MYIDNKRNFGSTTSIIQTLLFGRMGFKNLLNNKRKIHFISFLIETRRFNGTLF